MIMEHWLLIMSSACMKKCFTTLLQIYNTLLMHYLYLYYCSVNVFYNVLNVFLFFPRFLRFLTFFIFFPTFFTSMISITYRVGQSKSNHIQIKFIEQQKARKTLLQVLTRCKNHNSNRRQQLCFCSLYLNIPTKIDSFGHFRIFSVSLHLS